MRGFAAPFPLAVGQKSWGDCVTPPQRTDRVTELSPSLSPLAPPRAKGALRVTLGGAGRLQDFRAEGSLRALFPRREGTVEAVMINTAGGITGGDRFAITADAAGGHLTLTTQSAERIYHAATGRGQVSTELNIAEGAALSWLPQEVILFDGGALRRRLRIEMAEGAHLLAVESVILGRAAMGERVCHGQLQDEIIINRSGRALFRDAVRLEGDMHAHLARRAIGQGATGFATVICAAPQAEDQLDAIRAILPQTAAVSAPQKGLLLVRILAEDGFGLRRALVPVLRALSPHDLPRSWSL